MSEYHLDDLGWYQFERLCQSLLKARLGLGLETWGGTGDFGRDAYSKGPLRHPGKDENEGPFVFQVKFVAGANAAGAKPMPLLLKGVRAELKRIAERKAKGEWKNPRFYTLLTNVPLSGTDRAEVEGMLAKSLRGCSVTLQGATDIDSLLDDSDSVRLAFPEILGLRDIFALLERTVNKDILTRSRAAMKIGAEMAKAFVATEAYEQALDVLNRRHFVVLTGPPEMGKTTIARIIALARLSDGWEAMECRGPNDLIRSHDPERPQVFVADDAFGSTEYQPDKGNPWGEELEAVMHLLDARHWLLLTSRPAPLRTALEKLHLQGAAEGFPKAEEVIVDASELKLEEKALMLYRHAKSSLDSDEGRELIVAYAEDVIGHRHFTPLRIKHLVTRGLPSVLGSPPDERAEQMGAALAASMGEPTTAMRTSFLGLPADCRILMIAMLDSHESRIAIAELAPTFERHLGRDPHRTALAAAEVIDDHFVRLSQWEDPSADRPSHVEWVHPSVRDLVIEHLMSDAAARRAFLTQAGIDGVMLALSSAGGVKGERQLPLLIDEQDWQQVQRRVSELAQIAGPAGCQQLLALLADTATNAKSLATKPHAAQLTELSKVGLEALRKRWDASKDVILNSDVRTFYQANAALDGSIASLDLSSTWKERVATMQGLRGADAESQIMAAEDWVGLAHLMTDYDPDQLASFAFPKAYTQLVEQLLDHLEEEEAYLGSPFIIDEEDPTEYEENPPDLDWLGLLEDVLGTAGHIWPHLRTRIEVTISRFFDKASEWDEYREKHELFFRPDPEEREDYGRGYGGGGESIDVASIFSDL